MNFFSTVLYSPELIDNSWTSYAEAAADLCRAPGRWVAAELWEGGKKVVITSTWKDDVIFEEKSSESEGFNRIVRMYCRHCIMPLRKPLSGAFHGCCLSQ